MLQGEEVIYPWNPHNWGLPSQKDNSEPTQCYLLKQLLAASVQLKKLQGIIVYNIVLKDTTEICCLCTENKTYLGSRYTASLPNHFVYEPSTVYYEGLYL